MPASVEIIVNRLPLSLNEMLGKHWTVLHPVKKLWFDLIGYEWISMSRPVFVRPVKITYFINFADKRQRDFDNYLGGTKYINDALRQTFITRDDYKWLTSIDIRFCHSKKPHTRIRIEEVE